MLISNITHFLNPHGKIAKDMPSEVKELAIFLTLFIEATTDFNSESGYTTELPCIDKKCRGTNHSRLLIEKDHEIYWRWDNCEQEGKITEWEGTHWDNS